MDNPHILSAFSQLLLRGTLITAEDVRTKLIPAGRDHLVETPGEKRAFLYLRDFHAQRFTEEGRRAVDDDIHKHTFIDQMAGGFGLLSGNAQGSHVVNDNSMLEATLMRDVVHVRSPEDIARVLERARKEGLKVSIAGRRHSGGGHTITAGGLQIDIMGMNRMQLRADGTLRVETGATWAQVQAYLAV